MKLNITYLYYDILNLYGDRGNIIILKERARKRGIEVKINYVTVENNLIVKDTDILFMGGGEDRSQEAVEKDIRKKSEAIREIAESNRVIIAICGSYQLLGNYYITADKKEIKGLGIFDIYTTPAGKRMIGNIITKVSIKGREVEVVGFENHRGMTFIGNNVKPFGSVIVGYGNNGKDKTEGAVYKNSYGTYLHGPLLSKNPSLADIFLEKALSTKYGRNIFLEPVDDTSELTAKNHILNLIKGKK